MIGVTGGVASGKSVVAKEFARLGAGLLDADAAGHAALRLPRVEAAVRERWGEAVFGPEGRIDRARLASVVFASGPDGEAEREYLEQLTHPEIARQIERQAREYDAAGAPVAVLDAALLFEAGWSDKCEKTIFVDTPCEIRLARAMNRGWTEEDFAAREGAQESLDRKRARADVIIDNSGPLQRTQAQVELFWASLLR
jgi:dephospho-CoA kinase